MSVDPKLLEILVCPVDKTPLEVVELPDAVRQRLGVYPVVSGIPVMLVEEALTREEIEG